MAGLACFSLTVVLSFFPIANPLQSFLAGKLFSEGRAHAMFYDREQFPGDPEDEDDDEDADPHPNRP